MPEKSIIIFIISKLSGTVNKVLIRAGAFYLSIFLIFWLLPLILFDVDIFLYSPLLLIVSVLILSISSKNKTVKEFFKQIYLKIEKPVVTAGGSIYFFVLAGSLFFDNKNLIERLNWIDQNVGMVLTFLFFGFVIYLSYILMIIYLFAKIMAIVERKYPGKTLPGRILGVIAAILFIMPTWFLGSLETYLGKEKLLYYSYILSGFSALYIYLNFFLSIRHEKSKPKGISRKKHKTR